MVAHRILGSRLVKSFLFAVLMIFAVHLPAQLLPNPPVADGKIQMASLRPKLVWQRTSPKPGSAVEGPVLYQIIFRNSAGPITGAERSVKRRIGGKTDVAIVAYIGQYVAKRQILR